MSDMVGKPEMEYAGFWRRVVAYLIDSIIWAAVLWPLTGFAMAIAETEQEIAKAAVVATLLLLVMLAILVAYYPAFWAWRGQTPGKMAMGIKLIRTDGSPITVGTAFLRYLSYSVSAAILYIGFIMIIFDSRKQGLHDKIAGTYVVRVGQ